MVCLLELPIAGSSDHREVEHRGQMRPYMEEEHQREVPLRVMMKTIAIARSLGKEVQREVESPRHSDNSEWAPGEGLEVYTSGIDAMVVIGCTEDS